VKKHRFLIFCVLFALILNITAAAADPAGATDLDTLSSAGLEAYYHVSQLGIITGYEDNTFRGARAISREEFLTMLCRACGSEGVFGANVFADVDALENWSAPYVRWAYEEGIVAGSDSADGAKYFYPKRTIRTVEAVKMVLTALGYDARQEGFVNNTEWEANVLELAGTLGLLNNLTAGDTTTREDAAILFHAALNASPVTYASDGRAVPANTTWELQLLGSKTEDTENNETGTPDSNPAGNGKPLMPDEIPTFGSRVYLYDTVVMQVYSGSSNTYTLQLIDLWGKTTQVTYTTDLSVLLPDQFDPVLVTFADNQWSTISGIRALTSWDLGQTSYKTHRTYDMLELSGSTLNAYWIDASGMMHVDKFSPEKTFLLAVSETDDGYRIAPCSAAEMTIAACDRLISVEFGQYMLLIAMTQA